MGNMGRRFAGSSPLRRFAGVAGASAVVLAMAASTGDVPRRASASSPGGGGSTGTSVAAAAPRTYYTSTEFARAPESESESESAPAPVPAPRPASQAPLSEILAEPGHHQSSGPHGEVAVSVCTDAVPPGYAHCNAHIRTDASANGASPNQNAVTAAATVGNNGAYDPAYLRSAYNAPSATAGAGQTVAIVDAYDDPKAESDLAYYRSYWGLPPCTTANGCFRKVDQNGGTSYPAPDTGWAQEISLDVQMVSALCPNCKILLVEARSNYLTDLGAAVNRAVSLGANVVSNSYGAGEYGSEGNDGAAYFNHAGVAVVASSGDNGYGVEFPAASRYVTAVGGTSLYQNTNTGTRNGSETAWNGAGSGCSAYEPKPAWQHDTGCAKRTVADVSAVGDPYTGVWVYITDGSSPGSWWIFGGTSVAAPIVGAMYALAGNPSSSDTVSSYPYGTTSSLNDVTSGSNGSCSIGYLCTAVAGYDGPTGLGTPSGTASFTGAPPASPTVPGSPQSLQAGAGDAKVTLSWTAPASNGGSAVSSYNVYRSTVAGAETLLGSAGNATTCADTGLSNGTRNYYNVAAVNAQGEGPRSSEVSSVPSALTVPSAPQSASAVAGNAKITVSWSAPASNGGSAVTSYKVYRGTSPGAEGATAYASGLTTTSYTNTSVTAGTTYYYVVTAMNGAGEGARSAEVSAKAVKAPSSITSLVAKSSTTRGVRITWNAPSNGGSAIKGYKIYRARSSSSVVYYITVTCTTTTCAYNDGNTSRGYYYYYKVAAYNAVGTAPLSNLSYAKAT
jgi:fibronectin type 3 domain-containing protein